LREAAEPPCPVHGAAVTTAAAAREFHAAAVDAHRGVGGGDLQHLHGAVAQEQLRRPEGEVAGEVEPGGVVAAGLDAERVCDADVAAAPGAVCSSCRRSWCRAAERRQQQRGNYGSERYDDPFCLPHVFV